MGADSETPHHRCKRATCGVVPNKEHVAVTLKLVDLERLVSGREGRAIMATEWSKCDSTKASKTLLPCTSNKFMYKPGNRAASSWNHQWQWYRAYRYRRKVSVRTFLVASWAPPMSKFRK